MASQPVTPSANAVTPLAGLEMSDINAELKAPAHAGDNAAVDEVLASSAAISAPVDIDALRREIQGCQEEFGESDVSVGEAYNNLGIGLLKMGDQEGAEDNFKKALAIYALSLPEEHPLIAKTSTNLATLFMELGDEYAAKTLLRKALILQTTAPKQYAAADVADVCMKIGILHRNCGEIELAAPLFLRSYRILDAAYGPKDEGVCVAASNLGLILHAAGEFDKAKPFLKQVIDIRKGMDDRIQLGEAHAHYGDLLCEKGETDAAALAMQRALELWRDTVPEIDPLVVGVRSALEQLFVGGADPDVALQQEFIESRENAVQHLFDSEDPLGGVPYELRLRAVLSDPTEARPRNVAYSQQWKRPPPHEEVETMFEKFLADVSELLGVEASLGAADDAVMPLIGGAALGGAQPMAPVGMRRDASVELLSPRSLSSQLSPRVDGDSPINTGSLKSSEVEALGGDVAARILESQQGGQQQRRRAAPDNWLPQLQENIQYHYAAEAIDKTSLPCAKPQINVLGAVTPLRLYVSNTHVDTVGERQALYHKIVPEVNAALRSRFVMIVPVELRWGEIDPVAPLSLKRIVQVMDEIDRCRRLPGETPWVLSLLTGRCGPVQPHLPVSDCFLNEQSSAWVCSLPGVPRLSLAAIEMLHACLWMPFSMARECKPHMFCFRRNNEFAENLPSAHRWPFTFGHIADTDHSLGRHGVAQRFVVQPAEELSIVQRDYKIVVDAVTASSITKVVDYSAAYDWKATPVVIGRVTALDAFVEGAVNILGTAVKNEFPEHAALHYYAKQQLPHLIYAGKHDTSLHGRQNELQQLVTFCETKEYPNVLTLWGSAGCGKSALVANLCKDGVGDFFPLMFHNCGAIENPALSGARALLLHMQAACRSMLSLDVDSATSTTATLSELREEWERLANLASAAAAVPILIIVDKAEALLCQNMKQIDEAFSHPFGGLQWLCARLDPGVRVIVSGSARGYDDEFPRVVNAAVASRAPDVEIDDDDALLAVPPTPSESITGTVPTATPIVRLDAASSVVGGGSVPQTPSSGRSMVGGRLTVASTPPTAANFERRGSKAMLKTPLTTRSQTGSVMFSRNDQPLSTLETVGSGPRVNDDAWVDLISENVDAVRCEFMEIPNIGNDAVHALVNDWLSEYNIDLTAIYDKKRQEHQEEIKKKAEDAKDGEEADGSDQIADISVVLDDVEDPMIEMLANAACTNPLWLNVATKLVALAGLTARMRSIEHFASGKCEVDYHAVVGNDCAGGLKSLFRRVLARLEEQFGRALVRASLGFLHMVRGGISETELFSLLQKFNWHGYEQGLTPDALAPLLAAASSFIGANHAGRLRFIFSQLHREVEIRYGLRPHSARSRAVQCQIGSLFSELAHSRHPELRAAVEGTRNLLLGCNFPKCVELLVKLSMAPQQVVMEVVKAIDETVAQMLVAQVDLQPLLAAIESHCTLGFTKGTLCLTLVARFGLTAPALGQLLAPHMQDAKLSQQAVVHLRLLRFFMTVRKEFGSFKLRLLHEQVAERYGPDAVHGVCEQLASYTKSNEDGIPAVEHALQNLVLGAVHDDVDRLLDLCNAFLKSLAASVWTRGAARLEKEWNHVCDLIMWTRGEAGAPAVERIRRLIATTEATVKSLHSAASHGNQFGALQIVLGEDVDLDSEVDFATTHVSKPRLEILGAGGGDAGSGLMSPVGEAPEEDWADDIMSPMSDVDDDDDADAAGKAQQRDKPTTAIAMAARAGHAGVVEALLMAGATVDFATEGKWTSLHFASTKGRKAAAQILLKFGADANALTYVEHRTPLHYAAKNGFVGVVQALLRCGADTNIEDTGMRIPSHLALGNDHHDCVKALANAGALVTDAFGEAVRQYSSVHESAKAGDKIVTIAWLVLGKADVDEIDEGENTPLHWASSRGHTELAAQLLVHKANVNAKNEFKESPLHLAAREGHLSTVELLLSKGANVQFIAQPASSVLVDRAVREGWEASGVSCFADTAWALWQKELTELRRKDAATLGAQLTLEAERLTAAGRHGDSLAVYGQALERLAEAKDKEGHAVAVQGLAEVRRRLAAIEEREEHRLCGNELFNKAKRLMKAGKYQLAMNTFQSARESFELGEDTDSVLFSNRAWNEAKKVYDTSLWEEECCEDELKRTPLHWAARNGHIECVELLLKHGAFMNAQDQDAKTPLAIAILNKQPKVVTMLTEQGADA